MLPVLFLLFVTATPQISGFKPTGFRHGGTAGNYRSAQMEWDPVKGLVLGKDMVVDSIPGGIPIFKIDMNQTAQEGTSTFLPCKIKKYFNDKKIGRKVTWIRRKDYHILTSGIHTQTPDERFSVIRGDEKDDWFLQIKFVQRRDEGLYECQVPTKTGGFTYRVNLSVVVPRASIIGSKELHVQSGSTISIHCIIDGTIGPSPFVFWYHNHKMINYDQIRGGINVQTEHTVQTSTRLTITDATYSDSGNYTCSAGSTNATAHVFVSEGDKPAAIQRLGSGCSHLTPYYLFCISIFLLVQILLLFDVTSSLHSNLT